MLCNIVGGLEMNTLDALQKRKSIRGYLDKAVEKEKLNLILKYGNKAPNAGPFQMSVITNKEILKTINDTVMNIMKRSDNDFMKIRSSIPGYQPLYGAPMLIVLSAPKEGFGAANTANAVTNMCIAATELELGSCFVIAPLMVLDGTNGLSKKIGVPEGFAPMCGMLLGYESENQIPGKPYLEDYSNINYVE
jgi:FMN reductase [NAD(P)H]